MSLEDLARALSGNNPVPLWFSPAWRDAANTLTTNTTAALLAEVLTSARYGLGSVPVRKIEPASAQGIAAFDLINPRAVAWAERQAALLVVEVTGETRAAIRAIVARMARGEIPISSAARQLQQIVGLTRQQATAVVNFRQTLEARAGLRADPTMARRVLSDQQRALLARRLADTQARVDTLVDRYERRLLRQRTTNIARTESMMAANHGQRESWMAGRDQGLLPGTQEREYLITEDERTCAICFPMQGQRAPLGMPYTHPLSGEQFMGPPLHVNCRCAEALVIVEPELSAEERALAADFTVRVVGA
jgi:hypothetical protein